MLYFVFAKIMQVRLPPWIVLKIFSDMFRQQNVTGIAAIHYPLRKIDPDPGHADAIIHIRHLIDGTTVHTHANPNLRMVL